MAIKRSPEKLARRRAWIHSHPVRASAIGALLVVLPQLSLADPTERILRRLLVAALLAGFLGLGIYLVVRDPAVLDPAAQQDFGGKVWHKVALGFLSAVALLYLVLTVTERSWDFLVAAIVAAVVPVALIVERARRRQR